MRVRILSLIAIVSLLHGGVANSDDDARGIGDFGIPQVIVPAKQNGTEIRFSSPKAVVLPGGTIFVAVLAREAVDLTPGGVPSVAISTDGGQTFGPLRSLRSDAADAEYIPATHFALGVAPDGSAILLSQATDRKAALPVNGWRSSDRGETWQAVNLSAWHRSQVSSVFGAVLNVPNRGLVVFGQSPKRPNEKTQAIWEASSTDGGMNWSPVRTVEFATQLQYAQPTLINTGIHFLGLVRTDPHTYVQISPRDQGGKWDVAAPGILTRDPAPESYPQPCLAVDPLDSRHLLALLPERLLSGSNLPTGRISLYHCDLNRLRWHHRGDIARFSPEFEKGVVAKSGWLTPLGSHRWFAVFTCDTTAVPSDLYGLTFDLQ